MGIGLCFRMRLGLMTQRMRESCSSGEPARGINSTYWLLLRDAVNAAPAQQNLPCGHADHRPLREEPAQRGQRGVVVQIVEEGGDDAAIGDVEIDVGGGQTRAGRPRLGGVDAG